MAIFNRHHERYRASVPASVREHGTFGWRNATLRDLSQGGVSLIIDQPFAVGTKVEIEFRIDLASGPSRRRLIGTVVRVRGLTCGIQFDQASLR